MATTSYGTNNPLAVKVWAKRLYREALKATWYSKFMGDDTDSLIQVKTELDKGAGDRITIGLRMQLAGDGVQGDGTLEGNEEALVTFSDNLFIDQLRHAVRSAGKMSEQRIPWSVREEAMAGLRDWWANRLDTAMANQLAGNTLVVDTRYTGNQATIAPSTGRFLVQGFPGGAESSLTSTNIFTLTMIDKAVALAKTLTPMIRPLMINGDACYVLLMHPFQIYDLRTNTNTGQWLDIQKAAMTGGEVSDNPIFTGAVGMYNNTIIHEDSRMPACISAGAAMANTRRAVFCGAQALSMAFGQKNQDQQASWVEELFDYGNQLGVSAGMIYGMKKNVFNSLDFGTLVLSTWAATPS
jgi:N4-gp56 family major capsid protein